VSIKLEADHSPSSSTEVRNEWNYTFISPHIFLMQCWLNQVQGQFHFYLCSEPLMTKLSAPLGYDAMYSTGSHLSLRGTCYLHLQGQTISQARNQHEAGSKQSLTFNRLQGIISQKVEVFITTALRILNPTLLTSCYSNRNIDLFQCYWKPYCSLVNLEKNSLDSMLPSI
jgi:hypothetical protein